MVESGEPILVVGAGPTGTLLAGELRRHGVACRVVDKASGPNDKSRAVAVHSRTVEVLDALGLADELIGLGVQVHGGSIYAHGKRIAHLSFDELDAPFPFVLSVPQTETEGVLRRNLERLGGRIEWSTALTSLQQDATGATFELAGPGGQVERGHAPWVVGADGAHSTLRKVLGFSFEGAPYPETIVLADVRLESHLAPDEAHTFLTAHGAIIIAPLPHGRARVIATLPADKAPAPDGPEPTLAELQAILDAEIVDPPRMKDCVWISRFHVHHRLASEYRKGRAFVVGDAAHIHSPAGGQGMNTGLQDAYNLGWKLALVHRGRAPESILASYEVERRAVAGLVVKGTDAVMRAIALRNPLARALRDSAIRFLTSLEVVQQRMARNASGIGLDYRASPIVGEHRSPLLASAVLRRAPSEAPGPLDWRHFGAGPAPGSRALDGLVHVEGRAEPERLFRVLRGTAHSLLLFDGSAATAEGYRTLGAIAAKVTERYPGLVTPHVVVPGTSRPAALSWKGSVLLDETSELHHRYGAGSECLYLVRPDGYVGFRSQPAELAALLDYLARILL